jgi:hypothetical protein
VSELVAERVGTIAELFDVVAPPRLRLADEHHLRPPAQHPHEQPFLIAGALLHLDGAAEREHAAGFVARRVLAQRRADDVVIALRQRRGEQRVGHGHQPHHADGEDRRVPHRQAEPERAPQRVHGLRT